MCCWWEISAAGGRCVSTNLFSIQRRKIHAFFLYVNKYVHKSHRKYLFLILKCLFYLNVYQLKAKICILVGMQSMHAYLSLNNTLWSNSLSSRVLKDLYIPQQFHESLENSTLVSPSIEVFSGSNTRGGT